MPRCSPRAQGCRLAISESGVRPAAGTASLRLPVLVLCPLRYEFALTYRLIFKLFLQRIDAERAHALASRSLRIATAIPPVRMLLRRYVVPHDPSIQVHALGLTFPSPLGVAAGVDKDATWFGSLGFIGFGFVEVGTVTARPQDGNPRPRVFRMTRDRALLNKMGFPNPGAEVVAERLRKRTREVILGVNVGKSKAALVAEAGEDYRAAVKHVAPFSDYVVINVSSPNTPGLRDMQAVDLLRPLVADVRSELEMADIDIPILVKIGPDASNDQIDAVADLAMSLSLDGIIAVNTTVDRGALTASYDNIASVEGGGVSGAPLKARALEVLERLYMRVDRNLVLISVGGVGTPDDAWERILAGATLVQAHTGFVYGGPAWPRRMNRALGQRVHDAGKSSIHELIGVGNDRSHRSVAAGGTTDAIAPSPTTQDLAPKDTLSVAG
jgi:dihydroorotate dehydrogenase